MKTVLFVPGFKEDINSRNYQSAVSAIEQKGYIVKFISINWGRTTIEDWLFELNNEYKKYNQKDVILAGFSFGAMTALVTASKNNPYELWLFSLSPYFLQDLPKLKKYWISLIGLRLKEAFINLNFDEIAKTIECKTLLFYGEIEALKYPILKERVLIANKLISNSKLIVASNCDHDVADCNYIKAITNNI